MNIKPLIIASRPKTLIASISPVVIGTAISLSKHHFSPLIFLLTLLTSLCIQICTNFANDLFDFLKGADTNERKGPTRVIQSKLMSIFHMKIAISCIMALTVLLGTFLILRGGIIISFLIALALLLALGYTAGPFPLAYLGIAEIFVLIFFGPIASGFTYYLQTLSFSQAAFIAGFSPGFFSCSLLILNNLRDSKEDEIAKKKTLVVRFGNLFGKIEYTMSLLIGSIIPLFLIRHHYTLLLTLLCLFPISALIQAIWRHKDPKIYPLLFENTGKLLILFTFIFSLGYLL